ncbi:MAG TPA: hypothetical protein VL069_08295 [Opitutus sp.]|nr:hypothetical protein [Opitutus sp.]
MISDFNFESPILFTSGHRGSANSEVRPSLQLPLSIPNELLNLVGVAETLESAIEHFAPMQLVWVVEADGRLGGARATAMLKEDGATGDTWTILVLAHAGTGRHRHNDGGTYGECVITLAGELDDTLDGGAPVKLKRGAVMFHAGATTHEATANRFWVGLCHQPRGCTPVL